PLPARPPPLSPGLPPRPGGAGRPQLRRGRPLAGGPPGRRSGPRPRAGHPAPRPQAPKRPADRRRAPPAARLQPPLRPHPALRTQAAGPAAGAPAGGALALMAPGPLDAFAGAAPGGPGGRAGPFALGLLPFELVAGRPPFPTRTGQLSTLLEDMRADRRG